MNNRILPNLMVVTTMKTFWLMAPPMVYSVKVITNKESRFKRLGAYPIP